jgi:PAS domain S-box-containing protein
MQIIDNYRSVLDGVSDVIFVFDAHTGAIVDVNNAVAEMYGYTREEAKQVDIGTLSAGQYPYNYQGAMERIRRAEGGAIPLFEWLARDRSGRTFWVEMNLKRSAIDGVARIVAVVRDIAGRRRTGERLALQYTVTRILTEASTLTEATPMILRSVCEHVGWDHGEVWFIDPDIAAMRPGGVWHVFPEHLARFSAISGNMTFSQGAGLPGRVWAEGRPVWITDLAEAPYFLRAHAATAAGLRAAFAFPIRSAGGMLGAMAFFSREIQTPDKELIEMFDALGSQIGDFIKRKNAEEEMKRYAAELEKSNEELNSFASVASHDLQEPLRMISGFAELLESRYKGKLDKKADDFIHYINDGATRMQQLILDLLALSRVTSAGGKFVSVDANKALEKALVNLKTAIDESNAMITAGSLPVVIADESQLTRLLQNLVGNAVKYRGSGKPEVQIAAEHIDDISRNDAGRPRRPGWLFYIKDNGIGIEQKYFERIFQAFERLHSRKEYPGTGMGLAICKKIVERHGGSIWVSSEPGIGSTFYFTIPDGVPEKNAENES